MPYDRHLAVDEPEKVTRHTVLKRPWDVEQYMSSYAGTGQREGWRRGPKPKHGDDSVFIKRFAGVWFEISVPKGYFYDDIRIGATTIPPSVKIGPDFNDAWDKLHTRLKVVGLTMHDVEAKIEEMVKVYKEIAGGRPRKDVTNWHYQSREVRDESIEYSFEGKHFHGAEAVKQWKTEVEKILQKEIDEAGKNGFFWDTRGLVGDVLENYLCELDGPSRQDQANYIRTILEGMAKRGKIDRLDFGRGSPESKVKGIQWGSKHFVEKKDPYRYAVRKALGRA